jgi:Protein of unknown function (DUF1553)/Protein of unknown function (DUF1549)/Planctomycete cytochrome C
VDCQIDFRALTGFASAWLLQVAFCLACIGQEDAQSDLFFTERIQPIFAAKCLACHGPKVQKSGYRLDVRSIALQGGDHGEPPIVPSDVKASLLLQYVSDRDSDLAMPPKDSQQDGLTVSEIHDLTRWISAGASWPESASFKTEDPLDWWSFKPMQKAALPNFEPNPIDSFVRAKLLEHNLIGAPAADARTLARRLYFDLIGLPPTSIELDTFELESKSDSEAALGKLISKLLTMPEYGERWARHWLDVVHYGDTHGYDKDKLRPNAWPYRDYVIRAFNEDKPYSKFVQEQIAGDALWPDTRDGIEALGFIAAGPWDFIGHAEVAESKTDGKIARHLDRDDMVANTIGSFCSVTIHCAQCHQHKFDPISQLDYYRLQSVFSALDRTDRKYYPDEAMQKLWLSLERAKSDAFVALEQIEEPLRQQAGEEYVTLTKRIENASKVNATNPNKGTEFGYHSDIASNQDAVKWVQVDLTQVTEIDRVSLVPCYDDFNGIGAGFGFPIRFRVELSDDPNFQNGVKQLLVSGEDASIRDQKNPGLLVVTAKPAMGGSMAGRFVRVTATKLAPRQNDFIFSMAELQIFDGAGVNVAVGRKVTAMDSIEAPPRWRKTNLTDGIVPDSTTVDDKALLLLAREELLLKPADEVTKTRRSILLARAEEISSELKNLPTPMQVYAGGVHTGSGTFVGTGASGGKPRPIFVLARGQVTQPMSEVVPGALSAFEFRPSVFSLAQDHSESDRRVALAQWITAPENPLTWRSIVNRVWQYHFGRGFVDTPNDLGHNGGLPSHPELLDWLATDFRDNGGSIKRLHRMILMSKTYRQASISYVEGEKVDSGNTLLWRQNRRRLEAEAIRDSVLFVSGSLDKARGGPGWQDFVIEHPEHSPHYEYGLADPEDTKTWRRSIYRFVVRSQTQPWMTSLDCADPSMRVDKRNESLSAIQALALLNNGFILTQAKRFAARVENESSDIAAQVDIAYCMAFGTAPSEADRRQLIEFSKANGLPYLCRLLFNLNAFTFVD